MSSSGSDDGEGGDALQLTEVTPVPSWRYLLHIAYYGTGLVGWQRQVETSSSGLGSVQDLVEDAVTKTLAAPHRLNVTCCSRTDAGTHALYQYGTIKLAQELPMTSSAFQQQLNSILPESVRVLSVGSLPVAIKPSRFRSKYKKYIYYIQQGHRPDLDLGRFSWFLGRRLDIARLQEAISYLVGEHDFRPFSQGLQKPEFADRSTVRTILSARVVVKRNVVFSLDPSTCGTGDLVDDAASLYETPAAHTAVAEATIDQDDHEQAQKKRRLDAAARPRAPVHFVCVELVATGFLRHMVRRIIGTARPIAEGTYPADRMKQVLDGDVEPGPSAPTKGLWLHRTWLTQEDWDNDLTKN